jgi:hypothetical protein
MFRQVAGGQTRFDRCDGLAYLAAMAILRAPSGRRRRALAAPFVVTVAFAPACIEQAPPASSPQPVASGPSETTPSQTTSGTQPTDEPAGSGHTVIANPPPPTAPPAAPSGKGSWSQEGDRWVYLYEDGGRVWRDAAGECSYSPHVSCPAGVACNPPRPTRVSCPPAVAPVVDGPPDTGRTR